MGTLFISDDRAGSFSDGENASTSKEQRTKKSLSCAICGKTFSKQGHLVRYKKTHSKQKDFTCNISAFLPSKRILHSKEHSVKEIFFDNVNVLCTLYNLFFIE